MKLLVLTATAAALVPAVSLSAATLAADYQLQDTYSSSVGTIGSLSSVGSGAIQFQSDTVRGNPQEVLNINAGGSASTSTPVLGGTEGVQAQTNGFISSTNYSVVLLADFTLSTDLLATKILDFKNRSADAGLYVNSTSGLLSFNGASVPPPVGGTPVTTGSYTQIVLTRDGSSGLVSVYQEGALAFSFTDSSGLAILGDASSTGNAFLTTFADDTANIDGGLLLSETTQGNIARLRLYDGPLTAAEVAGLDTTVPEPTALALFGLGALLQRRRRAGASLF